jgi:hypothetical protein
MISTLAEARTIVENKFVSSPYIQNRSFTNSSGKYFPEEIEYWARKIINSNWSNSLFNASFENTYKNDNKTGLTSLRYNDYIGQTFYIDPGTYPRGLFLSSIWLYFVTHDESLPVTLDVRPLVNGYPSSTDIIPMSIVSVYPPDIINDTDTGPDAGSDTGKTTKFKFEFPLYLAPGYYCFTLKTNSSKSTLYVTERGKGRIISGKIVTNPYIGDFISSQQGVSWTIDQTKDLCFALNRAKFELGSRPVTFKTGNINFDYDLLNYYMHNLEFGEYSYIENITSTIKSFDTNIVSTIDIQNNKNTELPYVATANTTDGVIFTVTMTNTDDALSPIIDLHKNGAVLVKNYIDPYSTEISNSELTNNGLAAAKYSTKQIILNDEFDADGITVYLDTNKPSGTEIEVFYKILNKYDYSVEFKDAPWTLMTRTSQSQVALSTTEYNEETYQNLNITYTGLNGVAYDSFKYFAIKIVMYSNNSTKVPKIKNLRAIATV